MTIPAPTATRATWREWTGLGLLTLPMLALATDISVLFLAMPSISADLQPTASQALWILHIYGFLIGGLLITMGRLGDRIGRRRLLLIGSAAFAVLAVAAAWSPSAEALIVTRALLGVAGATLMPSCYSLLRPMFPDAGQRRMAIAVMFGAFAVGSALGPLLGGVLLESFWWGSAFLVNLPPLVLLMAAASLLLPEHRDESSQRLDLTSVLLSVGGLIAIIYALQEAAEHGASSLHAIVLAVGVALAIAFTRRQRGLADPLLDLSVFADRRFSASLAMVLLSAIGGLAGYFLFTQHLQLVVGLSPLQAGVATLPFMVAIGVGSLLGPVIAGRAGQVRVIVGGLALTSFGLGMGAVLAGPDDLLGLLVGLGVAGLGNGMAMSLGSDLIISTAPAERAGSAAALQEISGELGTALGIALGGSVGVLVYRTSVTSSLPDGLSPEAAAAAGTSAAAGLGIAQELGGTAGAQLMAVVRDGFVDGLQVGMGAGAALIGGVAVMVAVVLRRREHEPA